MLSMYQHCLGWLMIRQSSDRTLALLFHMLHQLQTGHKILARSVPLSALGKASPTLPGLLVHEGDQPDH